MVRSVKSSTYSPKSEKVGPSNWKLHSDHSPKILKHQLFTIRSYYYTDRTLNKPNQLRKFPTHINTFLCINTCSQIIVSNGSGGSKDTTILESAGLLLLDLAEQ